MPTKYINRLNLPLKGIENINFSTKNGLQIANGYEQIIINKVPLIQFNENQLIDKNIQIPDNQKWRIKNPGSPYIQYRSRDFCAVKILQFKNDKKFYISPFKLKSDLFPVLISPRRKA